jgi:hypothetical protein
MLSSGHPKLLAQVQQPPMAPTLINPTGQHLVYIGVGLLAIAVIVVLGLVNRRLDVAILASLVVAAVIIALVVLA